MLRPLCFTLFIFCAIQAGLCQVPALTFRHFTPENGFPSRDISQITQDKWGYMWFNNQHFLIRHDGVSFKIYRHNEKDSFSLPESKFYDICSGTNGLLLVSCAKGVFRYDPNTDGFRLLVSVKDIKAVPAGIPFTRNQEIWFPSQDQIMHRFDLATGKL